MNGLQSLILLLLSYCSCRTIEAPKTQPALLIVSYDGFKQDYLNWNITPNLEQFREMGTSAEFLKPVFPTTTMVNHFSIATGLYPENHSVLGKANYDSKLHRQLKYSYELFHYDESIVPIWTANELAGGHSGCMMWSGSNFEFKGKNCTFTMKLDKSVSFKERVDIVMGWFTHKETPANLVMMYIEQPDSDAHKFGPDSLQAMEKVSEVDNLAGYIQRKLVEYQLENRINVIHLSDHGMVGVGKSNIIDLTQFLKNGTYQMYGSSPVFQVVPIDHDVEQEIFTDLTKAAQQNGHFKVYNQENLPTRWHANNARRMGPIIAVADINYGFHDLYRYPNTTVHGVHGYDNAEPAMNAFFMAKGPLIASGKRLSTVNNIDLYNLFCLILTIECRQNDGSNNPSIWNELFVNVNNDENERSNYIPFHS
ncbi:bis(5'-adenosyl)-triphosphatase enpp4-like [Sitodiplosis mosellana]|uniref:bis(5'-adenosyl)-triphosphatase enpp4-like n=1 Tax=Sitodiplosis mosellana TaxID=263140 RepID=UPI00244407DE|nr:bis(5'-adenosyl)-triphosphatase enpp4-like [Sitodiplosis mosellana]